MKKSMLIMGMAVVCAFVFMAGTSQASFTGAIYEGDASAAFDPSVGPTIVGPTYTFTVDAINFDSTSAGGTTYGGFLSGPGNVNNLLGMSGTDMAKTIVTAGGNQHPSGVSIYGTFFQITGTAYFSANSMIRHDDGFWLDLGGTIYDANTPTTPLDTFLGNPAGTYAFTLNYGAWNGFPEVLQVQGIPEPTTLLLLGSGLLGLVAVGRKKFRK